MSMKNVALAATVFGAVFSGSAYAQEKTAANTDAALASQVHQAIASHAALAGDQIHVRVQGGVAYLSGQVDTPLEADLAESAARAVNGVQTVVNIASVNAGGN